MKKYHHRYGKKNNPKSKPTIVGLVIYGDCNNYSILKVEVKNVISTKN